MARRTAGSLPSVDDDSPEGQRLDKWLWFARVVKSRTLATGLVRNGKVRINSQRLDKPSHIIRLGDVLTIAVQRQIRVLKVLSPGMRRGPAKEAMQLYEDLTPPREPQAGGERDGAGASGPIEFELGRGRPTKKDRRAIDRLKDDFAGC